ncbi:MAG: M14 family murein peptide amidase A, partial [Calditrichaceae bacterium]
SHFILLVLFLGVASYYLLAPYFRHLLLHRETKKLYESVSRSALSWHIYAKSGLGRNIYLLELGQSEKTTLVLGAFHGDEQTGFHLVVRLAEYLAANPDQIRQRVIFVPAVNPDALIERSRLNSGKVDINRNFPTDDWSPVYQKQKNYPGPEPASELETRVLIDLLNEYRPDKIITIHQDLHVVNYDGPAEDLAKIMAQMNGYPVSSDIGYPTPGSFGNYAGNERNIPVITLELPDIDPDKAWEQNREALIFAINY